MELCWVIGNHAQPPSWIMDSRGYLCKIVDSRKYGLKLWKDLEGPILFLINPIPRKRGKSLGVSADIWDHSP